MSEGSKDALANQSLIHWERGELERAMELLVEQERVCRKLDDPGGVAVALTDQGMIMRDLGDDSGAQVKLQQALEVAKSAELPGLAERIELRLSREVGDSDSLKASLTRGRTLGKEEQLRAIFSEGRVRARGIRDEQESGFSETRSGEF